ncbi:putative disease resistance protein At3g14460 [Arachis hypogaea]|uniref:putative disease resistance protein At3g14460 n=1 Tax=Arachis hypogaea TaxID=3818 RepID=UPI003B20BB64
MLFGAPTPFPMLETLSFTSMRCWKEWRALEYNAFPRLRELTIRKCPVLRGDLPNHLPSLHSLTIKDCRNLSCCVPEAPAMTSLSIEGGNKVKIGELPPLLCHLSISGKHLWDPVVEAIMKTQLTCLTYLHISDCSSHIWFPVSAIPPSLQELRIWNCRKLEFQVEGQHNSLQKLWIDNSCDSVTSFSLDAFPNVKDVEIRECEKMESIVVSRSLSCLRILTIQSCRSMKSISTLWMAAPQLEQLQILCCPEMDLSATGDPHRSSLRFLNISYSEKLVSSAAFMNSQFQGLTHLSIGRECESVKCLPKEGWLPASLESLFLMGIVSVETLECKGLAHLTSLQELCIYHCPKLKNIEGEKLPASLIRLYITATPLQQPLYWLIHGPNKISSAAMVLLLMLNNVLDKI